MLGFDKYFFVNKYSFNTNKYAIIWLEYLFNFRQLELNLGGMHLYLGQIQLNLDNIRLFIEHKQKEVRINWRGDQFLVERKTTKQVLLSTWWRGQRREGQLGIVTKTLRMQCTKIRRQLCPQVMLPVFGAQGQSVDLALELFLASYQECFEKITSLRTAPSLTVQSS